MLESFPVSLAVGTVLGFLSGLGAGGGSLLILWLTLVLSVDPQTGRTMNLLFFLPAAAIACILRKKQGGLPLRKLLPALICGPAAAAAISLLFRDLDTAWLKKAFGILLLITGIRELFWKPRR